MVDPARLEQQFTTAAGGLSGAGVAVVVEVTGLLDPVMADLIEDSVADVSAIGAQLLVFRVDSSRAVVPDERLAELAGTIAGSPVPVAVWVGPNGASLGGKVAQLFAHCRRGGDRAGHPGGRSGAAAPPVGPPPGRVGQSGADPA